jgi:heme-degrading monooxygenase HmoA
MIARVATFRFPTVRHRAEAERNGSERVGPALAAQPGFRAIYYGRTAELEAISISVFDSAELATAAGETMNAQPLLAGQTPELLPTPDSVAFYAVADALVHDRTPKVGRLASLTPAPGSDAAAEDRWRRVFADRMGRVPGLAQAYLLLSPERGERISLTFWTDSSAMESGGAGIGAWQRAEALAGRPPALVGREARTLSNLRCAIIGVPATMPPGGVRAAS